MSQSINPLASSNVILSHVCHTIGTPFPHPPPSVERDGCEKGMSMYIAYLSKLGEIFRVVA